MAKKMKAPKEGKPIIQEETNNNSKRRKNIVRERLAYIFGGGIVAYFFAKLAIGVIGIQLPDYISADIQTFVTLAGVIIAFFFGGEIGKEKPES